MSLKIAVLFLAFVSSGAAQPGRFSTPACSSPDLELATRPGFLLCFSSTRKVPVWTAYELTPTQLGGSAPRPSHFHHDSALSGPSARDRDYRASGFSRGHMVPAEDLAYSEPSIQATFLLSNAAPQRQALNAGLWRQLENAVRRLAAGSDAVYVLTGPIFDAPAIEVIGTGRVAIPTHFFKVILALQGGPKVMFAVIVPNASNLSAPLDSFAVSVEQVQRRTGLDFFSSLEDSQERQLESVRLLLPVASRNN